MARTLKRLFALALGALALAWSSAARAEPVTRTFAIVVANNRSLSLSMPDLQYADDDGARYYRLFRASAAEGDVELLTTPDRTTARLYPTLGAAARPATQAELLRAVAKLRKSVQQARARGQRTKLYFVFAGHGEVAGGRGYVHLEDTRIDGTFIEREIIEKIPADTKHLLLDSCNSFFVINPRKPGGRRWATPKDMALGFSARHPEVGLFLSTNSDEEVFEWSELESGVFSHEVRSGLTGAADVNRDGRVTYAELGGFVSEANRGIVRENLRPQVYFSGPRGDAQAELFAISGLRGRKLSLGSQQARIWVRGPTGERLVDLHKEQGEIALTLPDADQELSVFVQTPGNDSKAPPTLVEHRVAAGLESAALEESAAEPPRLASRGDQLFGSLFATPYGPSAYASFLKTSKEQPEQIYGVKDEDIERMGNYLTALADVDRSQRRAAGITFTALGGLFMASGVVGHFSDPRMETEASLALAGIGAAFAGSGLYLDFTDGPGELARQAFVEELRAQRGNRALAFARTEQKLQDVARAERSRRLFSFWLLQTVAVGAATATTVGVLTDDKKEPATYGLLYGSAALMSGLGFYILGIETPTERLLRLYREDPGIKLRAGVSALPFGGMGFTLGGTF